MSYRDMVLKARRRVLSLTMKQQREVVRIYEKSARNLAIKAKAAKEKSLTERWAKDYQKQVEKAKAELQQQLARGMRQKVLEAGQITALAEITFFKDAVKKAGIDLGEHFTEMFSQVATEALALIVRGDLYRDGKGLSERLWWTADSYARDIDYMIKQAIVEKKSAVEFARDLETFVKPSERRPWNWGTVYPNLRTRDVDFNAQRLARTSITHAHRETQYRSAARNPFVNAIHWELSEQHYFRQVARWGEDECDEYAEQNNYGLGVGNFPVDEMPLSHPQCLCYTYPVVAESMDGVAERLHDWAEGGKDRELERWYKKHGDYFAGLDVGQKRAMALHDRVLAAEKKLAKHDTTKAYSNIWREDVTLGDYASKKPSIKAKADYFTQQLINATTKPEAEKFLKLKELLEEYRVKGEAYLQQKQLLADLESKLAAMLGIEDDPYSQKRKDAAHWFKDMRAADRVLRSYTEKVWGVLSQRQKKALYDYTAGSGAFNRPLRGYLNNWNTFVGVGAVPLDAEGQEHGIKHAEEALTKSIFDFDIWLQRGISSTGLAGFLGVTEDGLLHDSEAELKRKLEGRVVKDEAFLSTAGVRGKGFPGCILNVYAPKGTECMYVEPFAEYGHGAKSPNWDGVSKQSSFSYEFEVLINKGYSYKITKIEKAPGKVFVDIEVLQR